jgi:hypothetical protein
MDIRDIPRATLGMLSGLIRRRQRSGNFKPDIAEVPPGVQDAMRYRLEMGDFINRSPPKPMHERQADALEKQFGVRFRDGPG